MPHVSQVPNAPSAPRSMTLKLHSWRAQCLVPAVCTVPRPPKVARVTGVPGVRDYETSFLACLAPGFPLCTQCPRRQRCSVSPVFSASPVSLLPRDCETSFLACTWFPRPVSQNFRHPQCSLVRVLQVPRAAGASGALPRSPQPAGHNLAPRCKRSNWKHSEPPQRKEMSSNAPKREKTFACATEFRVKTPQFDKKKQPCTFAKEALGNAKNRQKHQYVWEARIQTHENARERWEGQTTRRDVRNALLMLVVACAIKVRVRTHNSTNKLQQRRPFRKRSTWKHKEAPKRQEIPCNA